MSLPETVSPSAPSIFCKPFHPPGYSFAQLTDVHIEPFYNPELLGPGKPVAKHPNFCGGFSCWFFGGCKRLLTIDAICLLLKKAVVFWTITLGGHSGAKVHS